MTHDPLLEDSSAAVTAIATAFAERAVTWAAAPQLRRIVAALDPAELAHLVAALGALPFEPRAERTRLELLSFTEFRLEMLRGFDP